MLYCTLVYNLNLIRRWTQMKGKKSTFWAMNERSSERYVPLDQVATDRCLITIGWHSEKRPIVIGRWWFNDTWGCGVARILKNNPDAPLEEVAAALIQAEEEARHLCQDNTTVLLYRPEADCGEGMLPEGPREIGPETGLSKLWSTFKKMLTKSSGQQSNLTSWHNPRGEYYVLFT